MGEQIEMAKAAEMGLRVELGPQNDMGEPEMG
jgi:hypothetical protein